MNLNRFWRTDLQNMYTSKLLLFGEHIIIKGSPALAIPFAHYHGNWQYANEDLEALQMDLPQFASYLEKLQLDNQLLCDLDISSFKKELEKGLHFQSNIPTGYGAGSSGALCAAVYDSFCKNKLEKNEAHLLALKKIFAQLESYFHGSSSGTDPLVCYAKQPLLLVSKEEIKIVQVPDLENHDLFLLDTRLPRKTGPLVNIFLEKSKEKYYMARTSSVLIPDTEDAIDDFLNGNEKALFEKMHSISHFQFKYFQEMIPDDFREIWLNGLSRDLYKLKLCGAGGGGFFLGMTKDLGQAKKLIKEYELIKI